MEDDIKKLRAQIYHDLGCDLEDLLEKSRSTSEKMKGRHEAVREITDDIKNIVPSPGPDDKEEVLNIKGRLENYFKSQYANSRDRVSWQNGFTKGVETLFTMVKEKYNAEIQEGAPPISSSNNFGKEAQQLEKQ